VESLASSIRSAARATYSAYSRVPIRWRLAGGSAALTLVILCGFAVVVGVLTTRRLSGDFNRQVTDQAEKVNGTIAYRGNPDLGIPFRHIGPKLDVYASQGAALRVVDLAGHVLDESADAPDWGRPGPPRNIRGWRVV
jgi:two-component system OmpR family sensor kinase